MLITKGANVNAKNPNGRTTLFNATVEGSKETADLLRLSSEAADNEPQTTTTSYENKHHRRAPIDDRCNRR